MNINTINRILVFSNLIENRRRLSFIDLLSFLSNFRSVFEKEFAMMPYHINLIDELHADENAHSRIFAKLLNYHEGKKYPFLEKFLTELCNFNLTLKKPIIKKVDSCGRIDIPIFDNDFMVVIENKVTDKAPDQNNSNGGQLARYIESVNKYYKIKLEHIYIVYTPRFSRHPTNEAWNNKDNFSYKEHFMDRYCSLSYKDKIYPWLKYELLPNINKENIYLYTAVEQYIDHLEGMFSLRTINQPMNMKLQDFLKQELGINDNNLEEAIEILTEKESELNSAINQVQQLKSKYKKLNIENHFNQWNELLRKDFPSYTIDSDSFKLDKNVINLALRFNDFNKEYVAIIECNDVEKFNIYFGVGRHFVSPSKFEVSERLQKILNSYELVEPEDFWYGWKSSSLESGYLELKSLINSIISIDK